MYHRGCLPDPLGISNEAMPKLPIAPRIAIGFASKTGRWEAIERLMLPSLNDSTIDAWERVGLGVRRAFYVFAVSTIFKMFEFAIAPTLSEMAADFSSESEQLMSPTLGTPSVIASYGFLISIAMFFVALRESRNQSHAISVEHCNDVVDAAVKDGLCMNEAVATLSEILGNEVAQPRGRAIAGLKKKFDALFENDGVFKGSGEADDRVAMWAMRQKSAQRRWYHRKPSLFGTLMVVSQIYVFVLVALASISIFKFLADTIELGV